MLQELGTGVGSLLELSSVGSLSSTPALMSFQFVLIMKLNYVDTLVPLVLGTQDTMYFVQESIAL